MMAACVMNATEAGLCFLLAYGFRYFSNLPASSLSSTGATRKMMWCGGFCKHGPWIVRLIHFVQFIVLLVFMVDLQGQFKCRGDTTYSFDCANSQSDCAYTQLLNCRYYWGSADCQPAVTEENDTPLLNCFNP